MKFIKEKEKISKIASIIVSFVIFICFVLITFVLVTYIGIFKESIVLDKVDDSEYVESVKENLYKKLYEYTLPSNMPLEVVNNVFKSEKVKTDIREYTTNSIKGGKYEVDVSVINTEVDNKIKKYAEKKGITISKEKNEMLKAYENGLDEIYVTSIKVPFGDYFFQLKNMFKKFFFIFIAGMIAFIVFDIYILYKLQKWLHEFIMYIIYAMVATSIVMVVIPLIALMMKVYKNIEVEPEYFYKLLVSITKGLIYAYIEVGAICGLIALILIVWYKKISIMFIKLGKNNGKEIKTLKL